MNTTIDTLQTTKPITRHSGIALAIRGLLAVVLGVIALRRPDITAGSIVILIAAYALVDGILSFVVAQRFGRAGRKWGWYALEGVASIALAIAAVVYPGLTLLGLVLLVALRALMLGVFEIGAAISWKEIESRWLLGLTGVLSIVLGMMLASSPVLGGVALIWTLGLYLMVFGIAMFANGLRIMGMARHAEVEHVPAVTPA